MSLLQWRWDRAFCSPWKRSWLARAKSWQIGIPSMIGRALLEKDQFARVETLRAGGESWG